MSQADLLDEALRRHPERPAVVDAGSGRVWTYADLDRRAGRVAHMLRRHGVGPGDHVAWVAWNRGEFVEALVGCLRAGAALVPLNPGATAWERERQLRLTQPALILAGIADAALSRHGAEVVRLDAEVDGYTARVADGPCRPTAGDARPDAIAAVLFTSGSTAAPRGARLSQRMLLVNAAASAAAWDFSPRTVTAIASPLWHAGGFGAMLLPTLIVGGTVVVLPAFDARVFWPTLYRHGVATLFGVPTLWQRAIDAPGAAEAADRGVRWLLCGGAPLPLRLRDRYLAGGVSLRQGLGMTEAGINLCTPTARDASEAPLSVGRPLQDVTIDLLDAGAGMRSPVVSTSPHDTGELVIGGPCVADGYVGRPDPADDTFLPDGRVRTGDLARVDAEGRVWVRGRRKQVYTSSGFTVSPAEVELALHECADLDAVAVVPAPDELRGEVGHAFVVPARGSRVDPDALRAAVRRRLSGYKVPACIHVVDDLPRTASGKVDRAALAPLCGR